MLISRPALSTEFRRSSCCHSQIGWRPNICKVLPGCIITHSKTPQEYTYYRSALGTWDWDGVRMWRGWVGMGAGNDSCGRDWRLKILSLPSGFTLEAFWMDLGGSWIATGFRLGTMAPNWSIGNHFWCLQAALWVGLGASRLHLQITWCHFGCLGHPKLMLQATRLTYQQLMQTIGFHCFFRF